MLLLYLSCPPKNSINLLFNRLKRISFVSVLSTYIIFSNSIDCPKDINVEMKNKNIVLFILNNFIIKLSSKIEKIK